MSAAVHRLITAGNQARARQAWAEAAAAYRAALQEAPALAHIWIQLGHAEKERGGLVEAERAYRQAAVLRPADVDPVLQLGHVAKLADDLPGAATHFVQAVRLAPGNGEAATELHRLVSALTGLAYAQVTTLLHDALAGSEAGRPSLPAALEHARHAVEHAAEALDREGVNAAALREASHLIAELAERRPAPRLQAPPVVFDVSDLVGHFGSYRLPTGIQRVQVEAVSRALRVGGDAVRLCCLSPPRVGWVEAPAAEFERVAMLSLQGGDRTDPDWTAALARLQLALALAKPFAFSRGALLVNLGAAWSLPNYLLFVRAAKAEHGIRFVPFVHDLVPIMTPEHHTAELVHDYIDFTVGLFAHADGFLVNSESTKRDLVRVAATLGAAAGPDDVAVIRLDADSRKPVATPLQPAALARWGLDTGPFVLLVSTVEPRKGHVVALEAWRELIGRHGPRRVPRLVCVGNKGWLNAAVYRLLETDATLASRVTMLSSLSDAELGLLYRACTFTLYPSLYEGWGLPITESLCYGKPVIASDSSSLPEAGGEFAVYVEAGAALPLADAVERMSFDRAYRAEWSGRIAEGFRPRRWDEVAEQITAEAGRLASRRPAAAVLPRAAAGLYYPLGRTAQTRIWPGAGAGEIFRAGTGWLSPERWGCWTRPEGGSLLIGTPGTEVRVTALLRAGQDCAWRVLVEGGNAIGGTLEAGERRWVRLGPGHSDVLRIGIRGHATPNAAENTGPILGVVGFFLHVKDDAVTELTLLRAAALGMLDEVSAYRDRAAPHDPDQDGVQSEW